MTHYFKNDETLKSEFRKLIYKYEDYTFEFTSDLGVFSKDRIDFASKLLIETYFKYGGTNKSVLDVGCGYGLIGITLAKIKKCDVTMIDVNKRALHLTKMNLKNNEVEAETLESNIYENIQDKYDVIITNPPIRAGKQVYMTILQEAKEFLTQNGELWFVMNKDHGAKTVIKELERAYDLHILERNKGFFVIMCKNR